MDRQPTTTFKLLSCLLFGNQKPRFDSGPAAFSPDDNSQELLELATSHHVILRTFPALLEISATEGRFPTQWIEHSIAQERARIEVAISFLPQICHALEEIGDVLVIKSLDHWPDLGSDLDLYTNAEGNEVVAVMRDCFRARVADRSWGDRLANKWNFIIPGLPELVEVHVGRLGQTGEQVEIADSLVVRARPKQFGSRTFRVPAPEERIIISTLQRMYRHFYLRLCDIADTANLIESNIIDYVHLELSARAAGLWEGVASYLSMVSHYVQSYRGAGLTLPASILRASRVGCDDLGFRRRFLRVPLLPHAAAFYTSEWKNLLLKGEIENTLRLSLLPGLAIAAALEFKLSGNDKGIW